MSVPLELLIHPELLSNEQLIAVIHERYLHISNLHNMARDDLLELFHSYCLPYGQRKQRDKGRGKILNKTSQTSPESPTKAIRDRGSTVFTCYNNNNGKMVRPDSDNNDRLKPPPDTLAGHMKRIKIATLAVPISDNNLKRKIIFGTEIPATDSPPQKKERKPITWP